MKKVFRSIWIGSLSGLALLTACCSSKGLSRQERRQLIKERDSIQEILRSREGSCVYGSPEVMARYRAETYRLRSQLDTINAKLNGTAIPEKNARCAQLQEQLAALRAVILEREQSCVYGSPEIIEEYSRETGRLRGEAEKIAKELKELEASGN